MRRTGVGNAVDWTTHVFMASDSTGEPHAADDAAEVRWWPLSALPEDVSDTTTSYFSALHPAVEAR